MILSVKIADFINKAQTKTREIGTMLNAEYDETIYLSDDAKVLLLKIYETTEFIKALLSEGYGGFEENEIRDNIDFFWSWLELNKVSYVPYTNNPVPTGYVINDGDY